MRLCRTSNRLLTCAGGEFSVPSTRAGIGRIGEGRVRENSFCIGIGSGGGRGSGRRPQAALWRAGTSMGRRRQAAKRASGAPAPASSAGRMARSGPSTAAAPIAATAATRIPSCCWTPTPARRRRRSAPACSCSRTACMSTAHGNIWVTDGGVSKDGTKGLQVIELSPRGQGAAAHRHRGPARR